MPCAGRPKRNSSCAPTCVDLEEALAERDRAELAQRELIRELRDRSTTSTS